MPPLVSIIIPCHNASPWLTSTMESALAQTWTRCEILFVDDGSIDDSLAIARTFEARGVRVLTQTNRGAAAARNAGLREAQGDFIQFLDADDLLSPGKIAAQITQLATAAPGSLATCRWGRFTHDPNLARFIDEEVFCDFTPLDYLLLHTRGGHMMHPAAWLVPRNVAERAGPWDERLSLNDDGEYFARAALSSAGICFTSDADASTFYRSEIAGSLSRDRSRQALASLALSAELVTAHLIAAEDSVRTRQALADYWQRLVYDLYPRDPAASQHAAHRVDEFGGSTLPPSMGARQRLLARFIGWRLVRRIFHS